MNTESKSKTTAYVALAISILLNSVAMVTLKFAVGSLDIDDLSVAALLSLLTNPWFFVGAGSFIVSLVFWIQSLKSINLSVAYPTSSTSYIAVAVISYFLFAEAVTATRIIGMVLIIGGVGLLYRPSSAQSEGEGGATT